MKQAAGMMSRALTKWCILGISESGDLDKNSFNAKFPNIGKANVTLKILTLLVKSLHPLSKMKATAERAAPNECPVRMMVFGNCSFGISAISSLMVSTFFLDLFKNP